MTLKIPKDYRAMVAIAEASGWTLKPGRHPKLESPDGHCISIPTTSGAPELVKAIRTQLRRKGLDV